MEFAISVLTRTTRGRSAARRMRRSGQVPGIVYGLKQPKPIAMDFADIASKLHQEAFHSSLIKLEVAGEEHSVLLREAQVDPVTNMILHVDFQAVAADQQIAAAVPLHLANADTCPGVKLRHGIVSSVMAEVHVHCLPRDLPDHIEIDIGHMDIGQTLHLEDLSQPEGVTFDQIQRGENPAVVAILAPRIEEEETPAAAEADAPEAAAEGEKASS